MRPPPLLRRETPDSVIPESVLTPPPPAKNGQAFAASDLANDLESTSPRHPITASALDVVGTTGFWPVGSNHDIDIDDIGIDAITAALTDAITDTASAPEEEQLLLATQQQQLQQAIAGAALLLATQQQQQLQQAIAQGQQLDAVLMYYQLQQIRRELEKRLINALSLLDQARQGGAEEPPPLSPPLSLGVPVACRQAIYRQAIIRKANAKPLKTKTAVRVRPSKGR